MMFIPCGFDGRSHANADTQHIAEPLPGGGAKTQVPVLGEVTWMMSQVDGAMGARVV